MKDISLKYVPSKRGEKKNSVLHLYIIYLLDECAYVRKIDLGRSFVPSLGWLALGSSQAVCSQAGKGPR